MERDIFLSSFFLYHIYLVAARRTCPVLRAALFRSRRYYTVTPLLPRCDEMREVMYRVAYRSMRLACLLLVRREISTVFMTWYLLFLFCVLGFGLSSVWMMVRNELKSVCHAHWHMI